jgi:hypothetical protein
MAKVLNPSSITDLDTPSSACIQVTPVNKTSNQINAM